MVGGGANWFFAFNSCAPHNPTLFVHVTKIVCYSMMETNSVIPQSNESGLQCRRQLNLVCVEWLYKKLSKGALLFLVGWN